MTGSDGRQTENERTQASSSSGEVTHFIHYLKIINSISLINKASINCYHRKVYNDGKL